MIHFPVSIDIGSMHILLHSICELLAFFVAFRYYLFLRKHTQDVISTSNRIWIILGAIIGSLIGSRLIGGLEDPQALANSANWLLHFYNNKTVVGGFLGGLAGVEIIKKLVGEMQSSGDLFTYPMILGLIIGRIGCFSTGVYEETYGIQTNLFTAMDLGDGILRHPVCLYEIFYLGVLWITIKQVSIRIQLENGSMFKIFMIAYLCIRLMPDFYITHHPFILGLSTIQLVCIAGLLYYSRYLVNPTLLMHRTQSQPV